MISYAKAKAKYSILSYGLDDLFVADYARLDETLAALDTRLPGFSYKSDLRFAYEKNYADSSLQREHFEYLTKEQRTRLRKGRSFANPLTAPLYLKSEGVTTVQLLSLYLF
jgi:hypothetical protein